MADWKDNRKIQFAVGVTVCVIFLRWLLTGDLLMVADSMIPAEDGEPKSISFVSVVWPMLVEAMVFVGVSTIAFSLKIWSWVYDLVNKSKPVSTVAVADEEPAVEQSKEGLVNGLARAVAMNDASGKARYETKIRRPYAIAELNAALEEGDFETVNNRLSEIRQLAGISDKPKGGAK